MEVWVPWLATFLFGLFALTSMYAGLKSYKKEEEKELNDIFSYGDGIISFIGIIFDLILWGSKKVFPQRFHLLIFRVVALFISLLLMGIIYLLWYDYFN